MKEMKGEVGKKPLKKRNPHFYDVTWLIFETLCPVTIQILVTILARIKALEHLIQYYEQFKT